MDPTALTAIVVAIIGALFKGWIDLRKANAEQKRLAEDAAVLRDGILKRGAAAANMTSHVNNGEVSDTARVVYQPIMRSLWFIYHNTVKDLGREPDVIEMAWAIEKAVVEIDGNQTKMQDWLVNMACPALSIRNFECVEIARILAMEAPKN